MKNNRMKDKIKKMTTNQDLEFLMKGWGNPETTEALSKAYGEKFNKEDEENGRCEFNPKEVLGCEEEKEGTTSEEG